MPLARRQAGFTLVEVVLALTLLVVVALGLVSAIAAATRYTDLTRERQQALNAVRAYVEALRSKGLVGAWNDAGTPADYLASASALSSPTGEAFKINYEDGSKGEYVSGGFQTTNATSTAVTFTDGANLAFPRDLNGNGTSTDSAVAASSLVVLPVRVRLSWTSATKGTQSVSMYVVLSN